MSNNFAKKIKPHKNCSTNGKRVVLEIPKQSQCKRILDIGRLHSSSNAIESEEVLIHLRKLTNVEPITYSQSQFAWAWAKFQIERLLSQFNSQTPLCLLAGLCLSFLWGIAHAAEPIITTRAYTGVPFGVGEVSIQYPVDAAPEWHADQLARIVSSDQGQLNYPAFSVVFAPGRNNCQVLRIRFLFKGTRERRIQVHAVEPISAVVTPIEDAKAHQLLMNDWWISYNALGGSNERLYSAPCLQLQDYLRTMLARRINLKSLGQYPWPMLWPTPVKDKVRSFSRMTDAAAIRSIQNQRLLEVSTPQEPADQPLPIAKMLPAVQLPKNALPDTAVEAIALHVPVQCFYARCQSFDNYVWLRDSIDAWGGTFEILIGPESYGYDLRRSFESRLAISLDAESRKQLDESISDLAIIGTDLFFRNGPSVGILFEAKDDRAITEVIRRQRDSIRSQPGSLESEIQLGDHKALLLTTSDGVVRSIYAVSGKYHLITTSSFVAEKFLACSNGEGSLGNLGEFRYARQKIPLSRNDLAFVYLSNPFFRLLFSPAYQVEITRRMAAIADLQLVEMARYAAVSEGEVLTTIGQLRDANFLPRGFGSRVDGSSAEIVNGQARDLLRGTAGGMLPIPDVKIDAVTLSESKSYSKFEVDFEPIDPVTVAIARKPNDRIDCETIAIDFVITPYHTSRYSYLSYLPFWFETSSKRWSTDVDLLAVLECTFKFDSTSFFAGFKDFAPGPFRVEHCKIVSEAQKPNAMWSLTDELELPLCSIAARSETVSSELVNKIFFQGKDVGRTSDPQGYVELSKPERSLILGAVPFMIGCCRFQNGMASIGKSREDLEKLTPGMKVVDSDRPAQVRFRMKDLHGTRLRRGIDTGAYLGLRQLSGANANLMWQFDQQFQLPPEKIPTAALGTIGGLPRCPLGGEYTLLTENSSSSLWVSSAWESHSIAKVDRVPESYHFPFTTRMRELNIDFLSDETTLSTHVEVAWQH